MADLLKMQKLFLFFGSGGNLAVNLKCLQQCIHKEQTCVNPHELNFSNKAISFSFQPIFGLCILRIGALQICYLSEV